MDIRNEHGQFMKGVQSNPTGQFKKGDTPWNKGMYVRWSPETEFKPGNIPPNVRPLYSERIVSEGKRCVRKAVQIKIKKGGRWEYRARYVWKEAGRIIPDGYIMYHKDGDGLNDSLENLDCISRRESLLRTLHGHSEKEG